MNKKIKTICVISLFAVAFGYIEASVVIYLRQVFFPEGFDLPFYPFLFYFGSKINIPLYVHTNDYLVEVFREAATLVVLFSLAWLTGRSLKEKLGTMLLAWGIWDIFYYVFLFLIIRWPSSLLTMDVLFLIPVPWLAPVILPISASLIMIGTAVHLLR